MSLEFRPMKEGRTVAGWVKALKGKSGVYVIRHGRRVRASGRRDVCGLLSRVHRELCSIEKSFGHTENGGQ
jgi:hypothetical protein